MVKASSGVRIQVAVSEHHRSVMVTMTVETRLMNETAVRCIFFMYFFMVALCNGADHYIFALWFLSSFFFSSTSLSGRRLDVYHTGLSANLECMSEMCSL